MDNQFQFGTYGYIAKKNLKKDYRKVEVHYE